MVLVEDYVIVYVASIEMVRNRAIYCGQNLDDMISEAPLYGSPIVPARVTTLIIFPPR